MSDGFVYCFSNILMPGILKIGMTTRTPEERLKEANSSNTWKPPAPYHIEMSKQVKNPLKVECILHNILERFGARIHPKREFFRLALEDVRLLFSLIDINSGGTNELQINRQYVRQYYDDVGGRTKR